MVNTTQLDPPLLSARGLVVRHGDRVVLSGVDLDVRAGEILAVVGPNGAGKTTLLRGLANLMSCEGTVLVGGRPSRGLSARERAQALAYVPQQSQLDAALMVREVVAQGCWANVKPGCEASNVTRAMADTDITAFADRLFNQLSHGERRRVILARALAGGAPLLLLDEPTAAMDMRHVLELFALLRAQVRARGLAVVVVLHQLQEVFEIADRVALVHGGGIAAVGATQSVLSPGRIEETYGVKMVAGGGAAYSLVPGFGLGHTS